MAGYDLLRDIGYSAWLVPHLVLVDQHVNMTWGSNGLLSLQMHIPVYHTCVYFSF